jgi:hypothetical protein
VQAKLAAHAVERRCRVRGLSALRRRGAGATSA